MTTSGQAAPRLVAVDDATSRDPSPPMPLAVGVDDSDTPGDMLDALALTPFATGTASEASVLLGQQVATPTTLAELYAMRGGHTLERPAETSIGQYL